MNIQELLKERVLVRDGAMGTFLQATPLTAADFGGPDYEGCYEHLNLTRPDVLRDIHGAYLHAGADIICTNTFGGTRIVLSEYNLQHQVHAINAAAARLAREAVAAHNTSDKPRFAAGSLGPQTKTITVTGGVTFDEVIDAFREQTLGLLEGGIDLLLIETAQDTLNLKATVMGARRAMLEAGRQVPVMISVTIEPMGTMLGGQNVEALHTSIAHFEPLSIGLNCATGPEFMTDHLRSLADLSSVPVSCHPNAGLPDEDGHYHETPTSLATQLERFIDNGWLHVAGGCCGTSPQHIEVLADMAQSKHPQPPASRTVVAVSGLDYLPLEADNRPVIVGERTNVIGSKRFRDLISAGEFERAADIGRAQIKGGAQVVDICLANPDRDEYADMQHFLKFVAGKMRVPLMIDSTEAPVIELALKHSPGKAIVNSINLEDGEERFAAIVPLLRTYGAAVVVGCIDEDPVQGMGVSRERKLAIAQRAYDLLTAEYGLSPRDIIFDPLVFPVGTGDENYIGSAAETIAGVQAIKERFPLCSTILGISNVSFGLPNAGREVLNAVFLYHCTRAGLDYAIVNSERLERSASISEKERQLAENLLFWRGDDPIGAFSGFYRGKKSGARKPTVTLPLEQRLPSYVVEGSKDGLVADLEKALGQYAAMEIINGPLMDGMSEVGRLFNNNELIIAEVLLSAEVMKASVAYLEPYMEKGESSLKGKIILATVKGDVHDIGKNLVDIVLSNNGFEVINLGIKVLPQQLIEAYRAEQPDTIGLSGLLVKSAQQMVLTAQDLREAGVKAPILVGGAALSNRFTALKIAPAYDGAPVLYAKDAMQGLDLANQLSKDSQREDLVARVQAEQQALRLRASDAEPQRAPVAASRAQRSVVRTDVPLPGGPDVRAPGVPRPVARLFVALSEPADALRQAHGPARQRAETLRAGRPQGHRHERAHRRRIPGDGRRPAGQRARRVPLLSGTGRRQYSAHLRPGQPRPGNRAFHLPAPKRRQAPLPGRFRAPRRVGRHGFGRFLRRHLRTGRARPGSHVQRRRRLRAIPRYSGYRHRVGGGLRRKTAPGPAGLVGLSRPAGNDHARPPPGGVSWSAGVVWLPRLPGPGGSGQAVSPAAPRGHRRAADRRLHDGPRGVGVGARAASPGGGVFSSRITPCL